MPSVPEVSSLQMEILFRLVAMHHWISLILLLPMASMPFVTLPALRVMLLSTVKTGVSLETSWLATDGMPRLRFLPMDESLLHLEV